MGPLGTSPGLPVPQFLPVRDSPRTGPGLPVPHFLQVRDRSGPARDSRHSNFYRSGTARDRPGTRALPQFLQVRDSRSTPIFIGTGPLGTGPGLPVPQFLQVRDRSGPARDSRYLHLTSPGLAPYPNFYRSGTARDWPGTPGTPLFTGLHETARDQSGTPSTPIFTSPGLAQYPNFHRSGTARDWPGTPGTPIFTGPGPLGTVPGLSLPQFLQAQDSRSTPIFTGPGPLGTPSTPIFTGPGPLGTSPGLPVPQFLQVRDRLPRLAFIKLKA